MNAAALTSTRRTAAVVTAVQVARDLYIQQHGDYYANAAYVKHYINGWLQRNNAEAPAFDVIIDLVDAVFELAALDADLVDPLTLVDDDFNGTSSDARDHLTRQYERDLQDALNRITWKA